MRTRTLLAAFAAMFVAIAPVSAQRGGGPNWELLGETNVGYGADRDVISVGRPDDHFRDRSYNRLRIVAERGEFNMQSVKLRYNNGHEEEVEVRRNLTAGQEVVVDLRGQRSYLSQIELRYSSRPGIDRRSGGWNRPKVKIYGENRGAGLPPPERPSPGADDRRRNWTLLGEQKVSFQAERDVIRIGQNEDWHRNRAFDKLHFVASKGDIVMNQVRIIYLNGFAETVRIGREIREGQDIVVDLPGRRSFIAEIELYYKARLRLGGRGHLQVYGEGGGR